ncbi:MAG: DUF6263 family protein [Patiriisocius sp.]|uniref:DUF6263 family protein n=1 Tax=Patiriisocius sp. TaxID=2822396 RepID=UPI003EF3951C
MNIRILFVSVLLLLVSIDTSAQEHLRYNLAAGEIYLIEQIANQEITMELDESEHIVNNIISGTYEFEILKNTNDTIVLTSTFRTLRFKTESNLAGVLLDVDTEKEIDEEDIMAKVFQGMINVPVTVYMLPTGKIAKIMGTDTLIDNTVEKLDIEDSFSKQLIKKSMEKEFGDESLASSIEQMTYLFPSEKVNINDTWNNTYIGDLEAQNTWRLMAYENETYIVKGTSDIKMNVSDESILMDLIGTQQTEAVIETNTGFFNEINISQKGKGMSTLKTVNDIEVPTSLKATMTYTRN